MIFVQKKLVPRLPIGYTEREWIQSDGNQYFNTGLVLDENYTFKTRTALIDWSVSGVDATMHGQTWDAGSYAPRFGIGKSAQNYFHAALGNKNFYSTVPLDHNMHNFVLDGQNDLFKIDNQSFTVGHTSFVLPESILGNFYLFARGILDTGTVSKSGVMRSESAEIFYKDILVRDFVPCTRDSDNEAGMYDLVTNTFFTNQGTGTFGVGAVKTTLVEKSFVPMRNSRLPKELQEVEWIKGGTGQYIDTGKIPSKDTTKIEFDILQQEINRYSFLVSSGSYAFAVRQYSGNVELYAEYFQSSASSKLSAPLNAIHHISLDGTNKTFKVDDNQYVGAQGSNQPSHSLVLFKGIEENRDSPYQLYNFKWSDNGVLGLNLIPCYIKPNQTFMGYQGNTQAGIQPSGTIGLYDSVSGHFFINSGTGVFTKGEDVNPKVSFLPSRNSRLPKEYQEVEYIQSSGTQYIDTGVIPTSNTKWVDKLQYTNNNAQQEGIWESNSYVFNKGFNTNYYAWIRSNSSEAVNFGTFDTNIHTIELANGTQKLDGVIKGTIAFNGGITRAIYLFARNNGNGVASLFNYQKKFSTQIYDGTTLVRNFIPCYRKADNVIGMYDSVNGVFYTNQGTGTFTKGNDVIV